MAKRGDVRGKMIKWQFVYKYIRVSISIVEIIEGKTLSLSFITLRKTFSSTNFDSNNTEKEENHLKSYFVEFHIRRNGTEIEFYGKAEGETKT